MLVVAALVFGLVGLFTGGSQGVGLEEVKHLEKRLDEVFEYLEAGGGAAVSEGEEEVEYYDEAGNKLKEAQVEEMRRQGLI